MLVHKIKHLAKVSNLHFLKHLEHQIRYLFRTWPFYSLLTNRNETGKNLIPVTNVANMRHIYDF